MLAAFIAMGNRRGRMRLKVWHLIFAAVVIALSAFDRPVFAQWNGQETPNAFGITEPSIAASLPQRGDPFGVRKYLYDRGVSYNVIHTNDVPGNMRGGIRRGTVDQGKLEGQLMVDLEKLVGWKDWAFYTNSFGIYDSGRIRRDYVGGMNTIAAVEAAPTLRLSELWLERKFFDGAVSLRFGKLAADSELFFSDLSAMFSAK
jgi:porin